MFIGVWQLVLVLIIVLILFGSGRLPQVMSDVGKGLANLRKAGNNEGASEGIGGTEKSFRKKGKNIA